MRLAINGYGRIGRCVLRAWYERDDTSDLTIVAINELASQDAIDYLTKYDSTHGRFPGAVGSIHISPWSSEGYLTTDFLEID